MENTNTKGLFNNPKTKEEVIEIIDYSIVFGSPSYSNPEVVEDSEERIESNSQKIAEAGRKDGVENRGIKENSNKLFHELDFNFIKQMSERMSSNKTNSKYPVWNWKKKMDEVELRMAIFRHVLEIMEGNYEDDGRPLGHIEALATNAMMLNYQVKNKYEKIRENY